MKEASPSEWRQLHPGGDIPYSRTQHQTVWSTFHEGLYVFGGLGNPNPNSSYGHGLCCVHAVSCCVMLCYAVLPALWNEAVSRTSTSMILRLGMLCPCLQLLGQELYYTPGEGETGKSKLRSVLQGERVGETCRLPPQLY